MMNPVWEGTLDEMPTINDTWYDEHPHPEVYQHLERARQKGTRLRITYGDAKTGRSWEDPEEVASGALQKHPSWIRAHGALGRIGRSMGPTKIPLEIPNSRSMGGQGLLTGSIVKIEHANKKHGGVIWQHPKYHVGKKAVGDFSEALSDQRAGELERLKTRLRDKMFTYPTSAKQDQASRLVSRVKGRLADRDSARHQELMRQAQDRKMRTWESTADEVFDRLAAGEDLTAVLDLVTRPILDEADDPTPTRRLIDTVRPHDRVTYLIPGGRNRDGTVDWVQHRGRVVMVKPNGHDHLVVNGGGRHGTPHVVTHDTLLKVHTSRGQQVVPGTSQATSAGDAADPFGSRFNLPPSRRR